ncbi:MAG: hypothetical protein ACTHYT_09960 [Agrococcus casei]|uniref:hypothetical protein n=1 Tax=Agrococcus casei TaxID=343512 RepID=UPI003F92FEE5
MNLKEITDEALDALRIDVLTERERRAALAEIPAQITGLAAAFTNGGGDPADLHAALDASE